MDEILWCNHSNETSEAVFSQGAIYFLFSILKLNFGNFAAFCRIVDATFAVAKEKPEEKLLLIISSSFHGFIRSQLNEPVSLLGQLVFFRPIHQNQRGQGFESLSRLYKEPT